MSGPNPPEPDSPTSDVEGQSDQDQPPHDTGIHSQAYSAPESEQFTSGPYVPPDAGLYDYDNFDQATELVDQPSAPRWPWVVGVVAIVAAISLVVSVVILVTSTDSANLATPAPSPTTSAPQFQDEITTTTPPPPPPPPPTEQPPPPPPETVTLTSEPPPPPPPPSTEAPPPVTTTAAPPATTTTTPAGPRQVTYSVTGTKAPGDIITITYVDASGRRRTQRNVYIPWSLTVTPISQSEVGSVQADSFFLVSKLNCSITTSDGQVLSQNANNSAHTSC